jgi:acyl dehydratase
MTPRSQTLFDDLTVGTSLQDLVIGPISPAHIVRWSAAMENWHRIHYDWRYATEHDRLPDVVVNGSWKQHILTRLLNDWVAPDGWLWKMAFQFRGMNVPGDTLTAWGRVTGLESRGKWGIAELDIGLRTQTGMEGTPGKATVVLPKRGGPPVPYPFNPALLGAKTSHE